MVGGLLSFKSRALVSHLIFYPHLLCYAGCLGHTSQSLHVEILQPCGVKHKICSLTLVHLHIPLQLLTTSGARSGERLFSSLPLRNWSVAFQCQGPAHRVHPRRGGWESKPTPWLQGTESTKSAFASGDWVERREHAADGARPHCEQQKGFCQSSLSLDWFQPHWELASPEMQALSMLGLTAGNLHIHLHFGVFTQLFPQKGSLFFLNIVLLYKVNFQLTLLWLLALHFKRESILVDKKHFGITFKIYVGS